MNDTVIDNNDSFDNEVNRLRDINITFSEPAGEIFGALAKAQAEMKPAIKNMQNYFKSEYADLNSVRTSVTGPLAKNGIAISQVMNIIDGKRYLITLLGHESGQWIRSITDLKEMKDDQTFGSHLSYMRRYMQSAMCNQAQEDDDGERSSVGVIDAPQLATLESMLNRRGVDKGKFSNWLEKAVGVTELKDVPARRFDEVANAIKSKPIEKDSKNDRGKSSAGK